MAFKIAFWNEAQTEYGVADSDLGLNYDYYWQLQDNGDGTHFLKVKQIVNFLSLGLWGLHPHGDVQPRFSDVTDDEWNRVEIDGGIFLQPKSGS